MFTKKKKINIRIRKIEEDLEGISLALSENISNQELFHSIVSLAKVLGQRDPARVYFNGMSHVCNTMYFNREQEKQYWNEVSAKDIFKED